MDNPKATNSWEHFCQTGAVCDYLEYRGVLHRPDPDEEAYPEDYDLYADHNQWFRD